MREVMLLNVLFKLFAFTVFCTMRTLTMPYISYLLGGLSIGTLFSTCIAASIQLMPPGRQALAASITSVSYMVFSALVSYPIQ